MKTISVLILLLTILLSNLSCATAHKKSMSRTYPELELVSVHYLENYNDRFELSSFVFDEKGILLAVSDKRADNFAYHLKLEEKTVAIIGKTPLQITNTLDLEAIDRCEDTLYIGNESNQKIYAQRGKKPAVLLDDYFSFNHVNVQQWKFNAGVEALAIDCKNRVAYVLEEREPRNIFVFDMLTNKVLDQFNIPETDGYDYSDAKFKNGYLYILERSANSVTKVDPKTHTVIAKVSYIKTNHNPLLFSTNSDPKMLKNNEKAYEPSQFDMEEALELDDEFIYVGVDNNWIPLAPWAQELWHIKGNHSLIYKFRRPAGF